MTVRRDVSNVSLTFVRVSNAATLKPMKTILHVRNGFCLQCVTHYLGLLKRDFLLGVRYSGYVYCMSKTDCRITTNKSIMIAPTAAHRSTSLALVCVHETTKKEFKDAHVNRVVHLVVHVTIIARKLRLL